MNAELKELEERIREGQRYLDEVRRTSDRIALYQGIPLTLAVVSIVFAIAALLEGSP